MTRRWLWRGLMFFVFGAFAVAALGFGIMYLWNWLVPDLFGVHAIGFWQAAGLLVLSRILVGGLRGGAGHWHGHWRARMMERWASMSEEERAQFRSAIRNRCGRAGTDSQTAQGS